MLLIILIFSSSVFIYNVILNTIENDFKSTSNAFYEEQFKIIWDSLSNLQSDSKNNIVKVKSKIEDDILDLSTDDLIKIEYDMNNDIINDNLHNILIKNIRNQNLNGINNYQNSVVIMNIKGYLEDYNYHRANSKSGNGDTLLRDWQTCIDNSYNKRIETLNNFTYKA